jgi:arabinofuranosyltransferase
MRSLDAERLIELSVTMFLVVIGAWIAWPGMNATPFPDEDAAMLMRYSEHLGHGHGIVWNVGEGPVEGGTDFLVLVMIGGLVKVGIPVLAATRALNLAAHLATLALIYRGARRLGAPRWLALIGSSYIVVGPIAHFLTSGFSAPVFSLFVLMTWLAGYRLSDGSEAIGRTIAFAVVAFLTALVRPEGTFYAAFCLLGVAWMRGFRRARVLVCIFLLVFGCCGIAYFLWRWHYFGYLLPLPYYRKGGGVLHFVALSRSWQNGLYMLLPTVPVFVFGLFAATTRRLTVSTLVPIVGFLCIWVLMTDEQNVLKRYQYPIVPMAVLASVVILSRLLPRQFVEQLGAKPVAGVAVAAVLFWQCWTGPRNGRLPLEGRDRGLYQVALELRKYAAKGYTIALSEGGVIPLVSEWRSIDGWGLNDPWIAMHHDIAEEYLEQQRPEVIMFESQPRDPPSWFRMVETMRRYATKHNYLLAGDYRSEVGETQTYYVKPGFADSERIASSIRDLDYGTLDHRMNVAKIPSFPLDITPMETAPGWK